MSDPHENSGTLAEASDEPKTPGWLTALGAVLFLVAGLVWTLMPSSSDESAAPAAETAR